MQSGTRTIAEIRGVPVRLNISAILLLAFIAPRVRELYESSLMVLIVTLLWTALLLVSIALHEFGHILVAQRYGMRVRDVVLTAIGSVARLEGDTKRPHVDVRIAFGGPVVSLALAGIGALILALELQFGSFLHLKIGTLLFVANSILFLINILPCFPMDGGRILRGALVSRKGKREANRIVSIVGRYICFTLATLSIVFGDFTLLLIAIFIYIAGGVEARTTDFILAQEEALTGATRELDPDFNIGPAPYERQTAPERKPSLIRDLLGTPVDLVNELLKTRRGRK